MASSPTSYFNEKTGFSNFGLLNKIGGLENNDILAACAAVGEYVETNGRNVPKVDTKTVLRARCLYDDRLRSKIIIKLRCCDMDVFFYRMFAFLSLSLSRERNVEYKLC